jgi:nitrogen regulatory protein P-II 1
MSGITYLTDAWIITAVVSSATGQAEKMLLSARDLGARGALGHSARGFGARERFGVLGLAVETEKDVIQVLVSEEQRDIVFEAMYKAGGLDRPDGGFMYLTPIEKMATFIPESMLATLKSGGEGGSA